MSPDLKAKWLAALRSGKYKQGNGTMRSRENEYCCLGVLCDVAGFNWQIASPGSDYVCEAGQKYIKSDNIMNQIGLDYDDHKACYLLNDGEFDENFLKEWGISEVRPHTFTEIADWLEKRL